MTKAKAEKEVKKTSSKKDLVLATNLEPAVLFGDDHASLDDLLDKIKTEVSSIVPDISSAKGRKAITANVSRITKSKTTLEKAGKDHVAAQKELLKTFDAQRKHAFTFLDELQKEVRKPLTEWEDKEKLRIEKNVGIVNAFIQAGIDSDNWMSYSIDELKDLLETVNEVTITKRLAEFEDEAEIAKKEAISKIKTAIENRNKYDDEQRELTKLREAVAAQDKINFEADQRRIAEEEATKKVIQANTEKEEAIKVAEQEKQSAIDNAEETKRQAAIDVENAAKKEREKIEAEKQTEIEEEKKRAANKTHKGKINSAAVKALIDASKAYDSGENVLTEGQAKLIIKVIFNNKVPNVKISY